MKKSTFIIFSVGFLRLVDAKMGETRPNPCKKGTVMFLLVHYLHKNGKKMPVFK